MNKNKGIKTMRKAISVIILLALAAFSTTATAADLKSDSWDLTIAVTALLPMTPNPLADMDLIPDPAPKVAYAAMNLDPSSVSLNPGHRYLNAGIRASQFGNTMFEANLLALVALNIADYLSTSQAIKVPGLAEGNPLMKPFVKSPAAFAAVKIGFTALTYFGFKSMYKRSKTLGWVMTTATNLLMSYVVSNNYRLIKTAQIR
jgi:hypothetical protein